MKDFMKKEFELNVIKIKKDKTIFLVNIFFKNNK
jgi:hypothetical protein